MWTALYNRAQYGRSEKVRTHICGLGLRGGQLRQVGSHVGPHVQRQHGLLLQVLLQRCAVSLQQTKLFRLQDELLHLSTSPGQALQNLFQRSKFELGRLRCYGSVETQFQHQHELLLQVLLQRCVVPQHICCSSSPGEAPALGKSDLGKLFSTFSIHRNVDPFRSNI